MFKIHESSCFFLCFVTEIYLPVWNQGLGNNQHELNPHNALELCYEKLKCNKSDIYIRKA